MPTDLIGSGCLYPTEGIISVKSQVRLVMRRVEQRASPQGGGRGGERPEVQVFSRLDIGHKDFLGEQFVNCRPFGTHHEEVLIC